MRTIKELNQAFQKRFKQERLRLLMEWETEKVELLEKIVLKHVSSSSGSSTEGNAYILELEVDGYQTSYHSFFNFKIQTGENEKMEFTGEESREIRQWLRDIKLDQKINEVQEEYGQMCLLAAAQKDVEERVINVELEEGKLIYTLGNGTKLEKQLHW